LRLCSECEFVGGAKSFVWVKLLARLGVTANFNITSILFPKKVSPLTPRHAAGQSRGWCRVGNTKDGIGYTELGLRNRGTLTGGRPPVWE